MQRLALSAASLPFIVVLASIVRLASLIATVDSPGDGPSRAIDVYGSLSADLGLVATGLPILERSREHRRSRATHCEPHPQSRTGLAKLDRILRERRPPIFVTRDEDRAHQARIATILGAGPGAAPLLLEIGAIRVYDIRALVAAAHERQRGGGVPAV